MFSRSILHRLISPRGPFIAHVYGESFILRVGWGSENGVFCVFYVDDIVVSIFIINEIIFVPEALW